MKKIGCLSVIFVVMNFAAIAYSATTYYEVWRSDTPDVADANPIARWLTYPNYEDCDPALKAGQSYYYWIRALSCEEAEDSIQTGMKQLYGKIVCPTKATDGCLSPVQVQIEMLDWRTDLSFSEIIECTIKGDDPVVDDTILYWEEWAYTDPETHRRYFNETISKDINLREDDDNESEIYLHVWANAHPLSVINTTPNILVAIRNTSDPGPICNSISQGAYTDKIRLSWDATTGVCSEINSNTLVAVGWTKRTFTVAAECEPSMGYVVPSSIQVLEGDSATFTAFVCPDGVDLRDYARLAADWMSEKSPYDVAPENGDGTVNFLDWAVFASNWNGDMYQLSDFASQWLTSGVSCDIAPEPNGDGIVDILDLIMFAENWLEGTGAVTIYHDDFNGTFTWTTSDGSVYIKDNEYLYISADGSYDDWAEKDFAIDITPGKQVIIEQRVKLTSDGVNYRLPNQLVYFEDSSGVGVTYLPSGPGQSYGWHFAGWTGINQPEVPGEDYWTVTRLVITSTGGELYMKPDDANKGWVSDNFSFIASANWSHSKISKIKFSQPWDSVNYIDYITIKAQ